MSDPSFQSARRALVLGMGESGLAMARWLVREGFVLRMADTRPEAPPATWAALRALARDTEFHSGPFTQALLDDVSVVAISPGLSPHTEPVRSLLAAAREADIPVVGEIELFAQALRVLRESQAYAPKVLAITGTNGKTTVTRLTGLLCQRAGLSVGIAGNIGPAALDALMRLLDAGELPEVWVLELSSFQLETTQSLQADAATILNVTQDHLDWHGSMQAYAAAKMRIFGPDTVRILNRNDATVMGATQSGAAPIVTFGLEAPSEPGHFGLMQEGVSWLVECVAEESEPTRRRGKQPSAPVACRLHRLMPSDGLRLRGVHNALNAQAALALARAIDLPYAPLLHALRDYAGEPHRLQWLRTVAGIDYVDDSKGTNVGATLAALDGLGQTVVLIAGGDGKGQDFVPLAAAVARVARHVMLIGKDAQRLEEALQPSGIPMTHCASLEEATFQAAARAQAGDAVLLSPACASLDMFRNYRHRGEVFAQTVERIALERGEVA